VTGQPEPTGTRVELIHMPADLDPVPPGTRGTVKGGTGGTYAQVWVDWDNGRRLNLIPGVDHWRRVTD